MILPRFLPRTAALLLTAGLFLTGTSQVHADSFEVTILADSEGTGDGGLSLREAITAANGTTNVADTITFSSDLFPGGAPGTINLTRELPNLTATAGALTIDGPGANVLTVRRSALSSEFRPLAIQSGRALTIEGLTLSHGAGEQLGGGILNNGFLTIRDCTLSNNTADHYGGAVYNSGVLLVERSTITGNSASYGGGISSSTDSGFTTTYTQINDSTISGNTASIGGGGVYNGNGRTSLQESTVAGNQAPAGAGVFTYADAFTQTRVQATIIAANSGSDIGLDNGGTNSFQSSGYNVIGSGTGVAAFAGTGDITGVTDPKLGPLQNNGGGTDTHALLAKSPAINRGGSTATATDQRGEPRVHLSRDAGAFEVQNIVPEANGYIQLFNGTAPKLLTLPATDAEGAALTYTIVTPPVNGNLSPLNGNQVTYTPNTPFPGSDSFTFKVNDGELDSNIATITLQTSTAPTLQSLTLATEDGLTVGSGSSVPADVRLRFSLTVRDNDGVANIRMMYLTVNSTLSNSGGAAFAYDPSTDLLSLRDASGNVVSGRTPGSSGTQNNGYVELDFAASTVVRNVANKTITVNWVFTPKAAFTGTKGVWAQVRDGLGLTDGFTQLGTWTVQPPVAATPVTALNGIVVLRPGVTSLPIVLPVSNPSGLGLTYTIVSNPSHGAITQQSGNRVTYVPAGDFGNFGIDTFTFKVNDGGGDSNVATITVKYNEAPTLSGLVVEKVVNPDGGTSSQVGEALKLSLTVKDEDGIDNIRMVYLTFNRTLNNSGGAALAYDRATNKLTLRTATGGVVAGQSPTTPGTYDNGLVTLDYGASSVVRNPDGKTLTVNWVVTPGPSFTGVKGFWAQVKDGFNLIDGWDNLGSWTINPAAPSLRSFSVSKASGNSF